MDRRDLLNGINEFLSDSIILPPGDFDKELLLHTVEITKMKNRHAIRRLTRTRSQNTIRSTDRDNRLSQGKNIE